MKSIKNVYSQIIEKDNIEKAFRNASRNKKRRSDVKNVMSELEKHVNIVHEMLVNTAPKDIKVQNRSLAYVPRTRRKHVINENNGKKVRVIEKPHFVYDQVIHHAIMQVLAPYMMSSMYRYFCGSVPKRGAGLGKRAIEKWLKTDRKNTKYILKMDIRHFYPSINKEYLKSYLAKRIKDRRTLHLLSLIIDSCENGLPLGFYTSQWLANFMLEPLDRCIKEELHAKYYVRYLDDMVIFGANKKELHKIRNVVEERLHEMGLQMKYNHQVFRFDYISRKDKRRKGRPLDFMGFQFYRDRTILRESLMLNITRKARRISKKKRKTWYDAAGMLSYMGWISNTDTYNVFESRIKPFVEIRRLKKIVSSHSRKERKKNDKVENSQRINDGRTESDRHDNKPDNSVRKKKHK